MRRRLALLLVLIAATLTASAGPAQASPQRDETPAPIDLVGLDFQVINAASRWCLTSELTELPCARTTPYRWRFRPVDVTGVMELLSVRTNRCLTIPGGSSEDGERAALLPCAALPARRWELRDSGGETARFVNARTGKCLTIESGVAVQGSCAGARRWTVRVVSVPIPGVF
jgi:hypothetical protein